MTPEGVSIELVAEQEAALSLEQSDDADDQDEAAKSAVQQPHLLFLSSGESSVASLVLSVSGSELKQRIRLDGVGGIRLERVDHDA